MRLLQQLAQVDVQEGGNMTGVEQTDVAKVDRLLKQHTVGNHPASDEVPQRPHVLKVREGRASKRRRAQRSRLEARE